MRQRLLSAALLASVALASPTVHAVPAQTLAQRAREAASRHEWNQAAAALRELVDAGLDSTEVLYNLGTAYAEAGRYGEALYRFEQVLRREPFHADAQQNARAARLRLAHRDAGRTGRAVVETSSGMRVWLSELLSPEQAVGLAVLGEALLLGAWLARKKAETREQWRIARVGAMVLGGVVAACGATVVFAQQGAPRVALVLADGQRLLQGAAADALPAESVREGERVQVVGREGAFLRVRVPEGAVGWLPQRVCGVLE